MKFKIKDKFIKVEENLNDGDIIFTSGSQTIKLHKLNKFLEQPSTVNKKLFETVSTETGDILAKKVLAKYDDPDYITISSFFPQQISWDFIGTPESKWKYLIWPNGKIGIQTSFENDYNNEIYCAFNPEKEGFPYMNLIGQQTLLSGFLPVSVITFTEKGGSYIWEQISFCRTHPEQTIIYIRIRRNDKKTPVYFKISPPEKETPEEFKKLEYKKACLLKNQVEFYKEMFELNKEIELFFKNGIKIEIPEINVLNASKGAIIKAINTCVNYKPHYGATRYFYEKGRASESFPPTTITLVNCCLDWNFFHQAKNFLNYYLTNFVDNNGHLNHRGGAGSSISEHGMFLESISRYIKYTSDTEFLKNHIGTINKICLHLLALRNEGKQNPKSSLIYGLIKGNPEDDLKSWAPNYWYSGNCWVWRGLLETGKIFNKYGKRLKEYNLGKFGRELVDECEKYKKDIINSMKGSLITSISPSFLPPFPGYNKPFETMLAPVYYQDDNKKDTYLSAYSSYRMYLEMLSSGLMDDELISTVIKYREEKKGEILGLTRIHLGLKPTQRKTILLDDWPIYNYLWALLDRNRIKKFLMIFYAHMAYHQSRGTFFAPEHTDIINLFPCHSVPSQLTIPLSTRWMLVWEEWDNDRLWLSRAVPRHWFQNKNPIYVRNAPTRWGPVNYMIMPFLNRKTVFISITLPGPVFPKEVFCVVRLPERKRMVDIKPYRKIQVYFSSDNEWIKFQPDKAGNFDFNIITN